ncbi:MAG: LysM peptidoglycan-binding domain-containing protein [Nitrospirae bacterium]|nr:LysM peptidoglycan-binding domain-containing protein [Nitrospirota bacterium]
MKKYYKTGINFLFVVSFLLMGMSTHSWADKTYIVKKGDSLYKISKRFKTNIEAISKANELGSDKLALGTKLIIPSKKSAKEEASAANDISSENIPDKNTKDNISMPKAVPLISSKAEPGTHEVREGDSLWKIAKKYSTTVTELKKLNNLKSNKLKLAQKLIIEPQPPLIDTETITPVVTQNKSDSVDAEESGVLSDAPASQKSKLKELLMFVARQTIGIPYRFGSNSSKSTDCSGYVQRVFSFIGIQLPRSAREQFTQGVAVDKENLSIGDLVFFRTYATFPSHVGIYLGNNLFVHASSLARKVTIDSLNTSYYVKRFIGAKRLQGLNELSLNDKSPIPE